MLPLHNDAMEVVVEESDPASYQANPSYLLQRPYQQPRSTRFGFDVRF